MANKKNSQILENYEIGDSIGKGRFAEVFRAVKRDLGQEVALKILLPDWYENDMVRGQFMDQAKLIARLRHPRIVEALDLGEENGRLYMAMEYLPLGDLHQWLQSLDKKRPVLLQVVTLVEDVAAALDFIHSQKSQGEPLVHGDVKPGNILLTEERDSPGRLRAKLSDLGLLTVLQKAVTLSGSSTFPQSSPLYISPEQANDLPPTPFSDQYALGVVAYELLTGQPPFAGGSDVTVYRQHKQTPPQPPSALVPDLPREIDEVLLRTLAKDPAGRYSNCVSFARALRQAVEIAEQKRFAERMAQARESLSEGQSEKALLALEEARQIKPDDGEVKSLFEQAQKTALAARSYQEASDLLDSARIESQKLRAEAPEYPDPQKLLVTFAPPPPPWWQVMIKRWKDVLIERSPLWLQSLLERWKYALWFAIFLVVLAILGSINHAATNETTDSDFQTRVALFWTASPTITLTPTPTLTPTLTPTPTATSTPSPQPIAAENDSQVVLLRRLDDVENAGTVRSVAFSPIGDLFAAGSDDGNLRIWRVRDGLLRKRIPAGAPVVSIAFSPNGEILAAGLGNGDITLWNAQSGESLGEPLRGHSDYVWSVAFSPNGATLASGSHDRSIRLWNVESRQQFGSPLTGGYAWNVAFSLNGATLASGSEFETVRLWDVENGQSLGVLLSEKSGRVFSVAFSPVDSNLLASGSSDNTIRLWNVASQQEIGRLAGHSESVWRVAFSPDGATLASASSDDTIRLWDVESQQKIGDPLTGHSNDVQSVSFSPDGLWLASSSYNEVFIWGVPRWDTLGTPTLVPTVTSTPTSTSTPVFTP